MSKLEYRAEMAATGGFDPDRKIFVMDKALVDGIVRVLEDFTRKLEASTKQLEDMLEDMRNTRLRREQRRQEAAEKLEASNKRLADMLEDMRNTRRRRQQRRQERRKVHTE